MSAQITTELVKELRDATGISVMQCRKALEEAEGDVEKALAILKKTSSEVALKKKDREVKDGAVALALGAKATVVTLLCETDFVAKSDDFKALLENILNTAKEEGSTVAKEKALEMINPVIQKTGENIQLGEIAEIEGTVLGGYVHGGKKAVVVALSGGDNVLAKDIAMHVAAMNPEYISQADITENAKKLMQEVFEREVADSDKPAEVKKKMLEGKMNTYFKEKTLLDQPFIKNPDLTIGKLLEGAKASIVSVSKYSI